MPKNAKSQGTKGTSLLGTAQPRCFSFFFGFGGSHPSSSCQQRRTPRRNGCSGPRWDPGPREAVEGLELAWGTGQSKQVIVYLLENVLGWRVFVFFQVRKLPNMGTLVTISADKRSCCALFVLFDQALSVDSDGPGRSSHSGRVPVLPPVLPGKLLNNEDEMVSTVIKCAVQQEQRISTSLQFASCSCLSTMLHVFLAKSSFHHIQLVLLFRGSRPFAQEDPLLGCSAPWSKWLADGRVGDTASEFGRREGLAPSAARRWVLARSGGGDPEQDGSGLKFWSRKATP